MITVPGHAATAQPLTLAEAAFDPPLRGELPMPEEITERYLEIRDTITREESMAMSQPWQIPARGLTPLHEFLSLPPDYITAADRAEVGLEFYAAILEKP
jgi:hypothetical protein